LSTILSTIKWRADKKVNLTGHTRHRHIPSPVSDGFVPPTANITLSFGPSALAASIARTATLRDAPPEMLAQWGDNALTEVEWLVGDGPIFTLSKYIHSLADVEKTSFAGHIGAGITDLLMNALGYTWRDNASCLSSSLAPHADFIYADGAVSGHGVVLAEAHGSFAAGVTSARVSREAQRKYLRQVRPHVAAVSPHGKVVHGYSIAFGSKPGTTGAFLHVAETLISKPRSTPKSPTQTEAMPSPEMAPTPLALSTHRSNFSLMNAPSVVRWIDWVRDGGERPDDASPLAFIRIPYAGRIFLARVEEEWPFIYSDWLDSLWRLRWGPHFGQARMPREDRFTGWFVIEEQACQRFLDEVSTIIQNGRDTLPQFLELPRINPAGFGFEGDETRPISPTSEYSYALFRDGLALLGSPPPRRIDGLKVWIPRNGMKSA
jgi:hypothetical protein